MVNGIIKILNQKRSYPFILSKSVNDIKQLTDNHLPDAKSIYKFISVSGGFASLSFIKYVAEKEIIEELTASTLRIGEKQFNYLEQLSKQGKIKKATFFIGSKTIMNGIKNGKAYNYFDKFEKCSKKNNWNYYIINNHSKIILMRTNKNYYVLETSSNLNENPKIEQYSFENNEELYKFYYDFFDILKK